jgi:anti-sigma-K factor RskA
MTADVHALAGAYALDALPDDERVFFERHLAQCEACRQEVDELTETAAYLGSAVAQDPPPDLRARVLAAADVTRQLPPAPETVIELRPGRWQSARQRLLFPVAACLALVVVGLTAVTVNTSRQLDQQQAQTAALMSVLRADDLETAELDGTVPARFMYSPSQDQGVLVANDIEAPGADKTYELWLIHNGTPVAAGLFDPDEHGAAIASVDGIVRGAELVAVTIEPDGGSRQPTGSILASAEL